MNRYLVIILALVALSCRQEKSIYYTYNHWQVPGDENKIPLKGEPKQVKETLFVDLQDTSLSATGTFSSYDIWGFDAQGNINYRKNFVSDSLWSETNRTYNDSGLQSVTRYTDSKNGSHTVNGKRSLVTQRLRDGKFKELATTASGEDKIRLLSFKEGGDLQTIEYVFGTDIKQIYSTQVIHYKNGLMQRMVQSSHSGDSSVLQYRYSKNNYIDSVLQYNSGKLFSRIVYTNNSNGDPVKSCTTLSSGDTVNTATMQYVYDKKGNWLKKLERITMHNISPNNPGLNQTKYALLVREITY